jgi:hypothetical protein
MAHVYVVTDYANIQRPSYKTLINLPGSPLMQVSGTLTAIAIVGGQGYHYFRVTIDNNLVMGNQVRHCVVEGDGCITASL